MGSAPPQQDVIAVVMDFDDTLGPDSTSELLRELGVEPSDFYDRQVKPLVEAGWDPIPAQLYRLIEIGRSPRSGGPLTRERLASVGRRMPLFDGVPAFFERLKAHVGAQPGGVKLELYLLSCGLGELLRETSIHHHFRAVWANELHYDEEGRATFPRRVLSHTEKTRYLLHIARGLRSSDPKETSAQLGLRADPRELRIPLSQFVYVGDGLTDVPCFSLIDQHQGLAIGVYKRGAAATLRQHLQRGEQRVHVDGLAPADYAPGGDLSDSLQLAVSSLCHRIALRKRRSEGER